MRFRVRGQQWFDPPAGHRFEQEEQNYILERNKPEPPPVASSQESGWYAVMHYEVIDTPPHVERRTITQKV